MRDYRTEIQEYLHTVRNREKYRLDRVLEEIRRSNKVCVFGIGAISYPIIFAIRNFTDLKIDFLCDNDPSKWGKSYHDDLMCISPAELEKYRDDVAILISTQHYKEIFNQLTQMGFHKIFVITEYRLLNDSYFKNKENIEVIEHNALGLMDVLEDQESREILFTLIRNWYDFDVTDIGYEAVFSGNQYFPPAIIRLRPDEAFVDAGAYDGDTLFQFIEESGRRFDSIFAFELDRHNFSDMEAAVGKLDSTLRQKIRLYNIGLLDREKEVSYETGGSGKQSTCINTLGSASDRGKVAPLSRILENEKVTFIKMDIEGSELKALRGASEIIQDQRPKLAICVYHRPEHLWEIPLYIRHLVPEYRLFFRHHTPLEYETVCYAVPQSQF